MVMETPSPQCVGREFVRQYYTLLHEAPLHLHRFYSHNSSFVHGGVEKPGEEQPPVMGQADIHEKIVSLNFRDCHAKIRQVDSQATVGNAVVVQVTGELSNNGQQMRRFMQTFVLAPQSPKKYYVHNDIFRYQDEVFHDNDTDTENQDDAVDSEVELEREPDSTVSSEMPETQQAPSSYFDGGNTLSNGSGLMEEEPVDTPTTPKSEEEEILEQEEELGQIDTFKPDKEEPKMESLEQEDQPQATDEAPKPFSWAALASKNTQSSSVPPPVQPSTQPLSRQQAPGFGSRTEVKQDNSPTAPKEQRAPRGARDRPDRGRDRDRTSMNREEGEPIGDARRGGARYPDSHQLFVGNLPHNVLEKDLRAFFEEFGTVVELRINTKNGREKTPNFGFVMFDSLDPVQTILNSRPIMFNEHRLNVEEKKPRGSEGRPVRGPPTRSGSAGGGGGFGRGSAGRGMGPRGGGPPGMRENRGGMSRGGSGGMTGPRR